MMNNNIPNVGNQSMSVDLTGMQKAFGYIANNGISGFPSIKSGLETIQNLADFLKTASANEKIGYLSRLNTIDANIAYLKKGIVQAVFLRSKGMIDLQADNIMQPSKDKTTATVSAALSMNYLGKLVLMDLNKYVVQPISETLDEIEMTVKAHIMKGVIIDDQERKLYENLEVDASVKSPFEIANRTGSNVPGFGTNLNLKNALIAEAQQIQKPKDMPQEEYQALLSLLKKVKEQRELLKRIEVAAHDYSGLGLSVFNAPLSKI